MEDKCKIEIYSPCYEGSRFEGHRFPLDSLGDLSMLGSMTIEMAKAIYLEKNPGRQRVPRNFTNGISIELESIEPGSTITRLVLVTTLNGLFPQGNTEYFTQAPQRIKKAIEAAHLNQEFKDVVPDNVLNYFNQIGSNLKDDERIIFGDKSSSNIVLDKESRKRLILAASKAKEYTGPVELRGIVTALDKERKTFEVQTAAGTKIKGDYTPTHLEVLQSALVEMENGRKILIKGTGTFNAVDKLLKIDSLDEVLALDPLDVPARLEELAQLPKGWLGEQHGEPLDSKAARWLGDVFDRWYDSEYLPLPATFPTPDGNVQFEWSLNGQEISLAVDLENKQADYYALSTKNQSEVCEALDLNSPEAWMRLNQLIKGIHG
jgi:hypothetical protein